MAKVITDSQHYTDIANAIREKNGESTQYKPSEMATAIQAIESGGADFSEVESKLSNGFTDYSYYFSCKKMSEVPIELLQHTSTGTDFSFMFEKAYRVMGSNVTIPFFDTSSGISFKGMFSNNSGRFPDGIPLFNTSKGTDFSKMFYGTDYLTGDILPLFDTSNGENFSEMFWGCAKLETVPLFDTSNGENFSRMFNGCTSLKSIPLFDTSNGNVAGMFYECSSLTTIPPLDFSSTTTLNITFRNATALQSIPSLASAKATDFYYTFSGCTSLHTIEGIDFSSATKVTNTFGTCSALENIKVNGTIKITGLSFSACTLLTYDSLMSIINALYDYAADGSTGTYKLTLGSTNLAKLTDAEKAIATQKGWTLA